MPEGPLLHRPTSLKLEGNLDQSQEHRTEMESKTGRTFTISLRASSLTEHNRSALIDHATQENQCHQPQISSDGDRQKASSMERFTRWIKEAIHIRKEGQQVMNRDEDAYDGFLDTASSRRVKNRKN